MNFLHVIHYPIFGGPHNQALQLNQPLKKRGWKTIVLLPEEEGNAADRLIKGNVDVVQIPLHRIRATLSIGVQTTFFLAFWREVSAIRCLIKKYRIALVLIGGLTNPHAAIAARLEGIPLVWQILDTRTPMLLRRLLMPIVSRTSDILMCTGNDVARVHPGALGMKRRLVRFFPPVDTQRFKPSQKARAQSRYELNIPRDSILIGTLGNITPQKGYEYLIQSIYIIHFQIPNMFIRIFGSHIPTQAAYEQKLLKYARRLGLMNDGRLRFIDPGARTADLLPALDIFVMTSVPRSEGIPTAILEAMACGLPVVASDVGGIHEVVENGKTGFLVPPMKPKLFSDAIIRLVHDHHLRDRMSIEARRQSVDRFNLGICADIHAYAFKSAFAHHASTKLSN